MSADDFEEIRRKLKQEIKNELLAEISKELKREEQATEQEKLELASHVEAVSHQDATPVKVESVKAKEEYVVSIPALLKITTHALKYANKKIPREEWVEVIGLLAGVQEEKGKVLHIVDAYPMGHGNAIYAEIKDYKNFVRAFQDINSKNTFICGWYHSHPSYGLFISEEDYGTQSRYQRLWDQSVALVVDPYMINGKSYGFKIFRADLKSGKWFSMPFHLENNIDPALLPSLLEFMAPVVEGKPVYLEYDE